MMPVSVRSNQAKCGKTDRVNERAEPEAGPKEL